MPNKRSDNLDKAGKAYWDNLWQGRPVPYAVDPRLCGLHNYVNRRFHDYFIRIFDAQHTNGQQLLEIGCARSAWLPYFSREFGFSVSGIDYSEEGCHQAKMILQQADVSGRIIHADFFSPPQHMLEAFDVVVSFGVVEHFQNTAACVASVAKFLKPGGLIITVIPNLTGAIGWIQKHTGRAIYNIHVPLGRKALFAAHKHAGLSVRSCRYFLSINWGVLNFSDWRSRHFYWLASRAQSTVSKMFWFIEQAGLGIKPNRVTSPYVICLARKPPRR